MVAKALALIPCQLQFLIADLGFRVTEVKEARIFDNYYVDLTNDLLNVRVVRDRSVVSVDVGPIHIRDRWFPLPHIADILAQNKRLNDGYSLDQLSEVLRSSMDEISRMLLVDQISTTEAQVTALGMERLNRLFPGSICKR